MTDLSIIIVTWNTRELALGCLASIERALVPAETAGQRPLEIETLVVDNGSRDGTAEALRVGFPWVQVTALSRNVGFAAACNIAMKRMSGRYVLLLNSDAQIRSGVLETCVRFLDEHPDVGIVGPQLFNPDGSKQNSIHNYPRVTTELLPVGVFKFFFRRRFPSRRWTGDEPIDVEAVVGAALFARASVVRRVGLLSEEYFFFLEETDWCWRVRQAGLRVVHLPHVGVVHVSGASSKRKSRALTRIEYHRSLYRFFRKWRGMSSVLIVFLVRLVKAFLYVVTSAPAAPLGGPHRARWIADRDVFLWHLRGCPAAVGLGQIGEIDSVPAGARDRPISNPLASAGIDSSREPDARA